MKTEFFDSFIKDMNGITDATIRQRVEKAIESVETAGNLHNIPQLEKLKGHKTAYRIRVGVLRLGVYVKGDIVVFRCCLHRSKIYKVFPK